MFIAGGSQLGWTNVYSENVYKLIFEEKNLKSREMKKDVVVGIEKGLKSDSKLIS